VLAEPAYRKAIAVDPHEIPGYIDLITFLIRNRRVGEVGPLFAASDKYVTPDDDVLASVLNDLEEDITIEDAERLVAAEAPRLKASVWANLSLAEVYIREKRFTTALEVPKRAAQMDPKLAYTHLTMSTVYQKMSRLKDALKSADDAHSLNPESSNTHYRRACVLALLGRKATAMAALEKSIEIDPEIVKFLAHDEDLAALRSLPAFKKLLREAEKQTAQPGPK
jgi:tetratricopeptide (TPR) repeat protein